MQGGVHDTASRAGIAMSERPGTLAMAVSQGKPGNEPPLTATSSCPGAGWQRGPTRTAVGTYIDASGRIPVHRRRFAGARNGNIASRR